MKKQLASTKNFVNRHKRTATIVALVVTATGTVLMFRNQKAFNEFLKEHNLLDEYYTTEVTV